MDVVVLVCTIFRKRLSTWTCTLLMMLLSTMSQCMVNILGGKEEINSPPYVMVIRATSQLLYFQIGLGSVTLKLWRSLTEKIPSCLHCTSIYVHAVSTYFANDTNPYTGPISLTHWKKWYPSLFSSLKITPFLQQNTDFSAQNDPFFVIKH